MQDQSIQQTSFQNSWLNATSYQEGWAKLETLCIKFEDYDLQTPNTMIGNSACDRQDNAT